MIRCLILSLTFVLSLNAFPQGDVWERWDPEVLRSLNTGSGADYLSDEEKKVILFMNMARREGALFQETFLDSYIESNHLASSSYTRSLQRDLRKLPSLQPLVPEPDLTSVARGHATRSGQDGYVGHRDFNKRFEPLLGHPYNHVGENCSYGYENAVEIVLTLLIDEGVKGMGHRENILSEGFNSVGVAIRPHKKFRTNCVIDFGQKQRSGLNSPPI